MVAITSASPVVNYVTTEHNQHQIILLDDRGTLLCEQPAQSCYMKLERLRVKPASYQL